jgi:hypothetical protein
LKKLKSKKKLRAENSKKKQLFKARKGRKHKKSTKNTKNTSFILKKLSKVKGENRKVLKN